MTFWRFLFSAFATFWPLGAHAADSFMVYYTDVLPPERFKEYTIIAFDAEKHPALEPLRYQNKDLLGYISLGEAENYRPYFDALKERKLLLRENSDWAGHFIIDIRKPEWAAYIIEVMIPDILQKGFNGIMIDTMDSPLALEAKDPSQFMGMHKAGVKLIKAIRQNYPNLKIMLNRGFEIFPEVAGDIDYMLAESVLVNYDIKKKTFQYFPNEVYQYHVNLFKNAQKTAPNLKIVTLDYWDLGDTEGVKKLYATQRKNGFIPYVAALELQDAYAEPK